MTNTATPERVTRIPQVDDVVIIMADDNYGHQCRIHRLTIAETVTVRMDVTDRLEFYRRDELAYADGAQLETADEQSAREARVRTLARLHSQARTLRSIRPGDREGAIITMASRYGAAERLKGGDRYDIDLSYRAADRRFAALQRLVYGD